MTQEQILTNNTSSIILYTSEDGVTQLEVKLLEETVWLTNNQMAKLFDREESNIRRHIINIFKEGELLKENNVQNLHVNGVKKTVPFYTLDVIISVGYRVKSINGTRFRQWANKILKDYLIKGYVINQNIKIERYNELKNIVQLMSRTISLQEMFLTANTMVYSMSLMIMYMHLTPLIVTITKHYQLIKQLLKSHLERHMKMQYQQLML